MTFLLTMMTKLTILLLDNDDANIVVIITRSAAYLCKAMILLKHFSLLMLPYDGVPPVEAAIVQLSRKWRQFNRRNIQRQHRVSTSGRVLILDKDSTVPSLSVWVEQHRPRWASVPLHTTVSASAAASCRSDVVRQTVRPTKTARLRLLPLETRRLWLVARISSCRGGVGTERLDTKRRLAIWTHSEISNI